VAPFANAFFFIRIHHRRIFIAFVRFIFVYKSSLIIPCRLHFGMQNKLFLSLAVLVAAFSPLISAFSWDFSEKTRCRWRNLPTSEGDWHAGDTVTVQYKFLRKTQEPSDYEIYLDGATMKEKVMRNALISDKQDEEGFWTATFRLPDNLWTGESYSLRLRERGIFFKSKIAVSPQFPISSKSDNRPQDPLVTPPPTDVTLSANTTDTMAQVAPTNAEPVEMTIQNSTKEEQPNPFGFLMTKPSVPASVTPQQQQVMGAAVQPQQRQLAAAANPRAMPAAVGGEFNMW
jgi:hypothetical protein